MYSPSLRRKDPIVALTMKSNKTQKQAAMTSQKRVKSQKKSKIPSQAILEGRKVSIPAASARVFKNTPASMVSLGGKGDARILVKHTEFIADVRSLNVLGYIPGPKYPINPGMAITFPWLSTIAKNYESYRFRKLCFHYETTSPSTFAGTVIYSVDFDAADEQPLTKADALACHLAERGAPWTSFSMPLDRSDLWKMTQRYIRSGATLNNEDIKTYDVGNLWLSTDHATVGMVGELHVSYEIELMTPQPAGPPLGFKVVGGGGITNNNIFGTTPVKTGNLDVGVTNSPGNNLLTFNTAGEYILNLHLTGQTFLNIPTTNPVITTNATYSAATWVVASVVAPSVSQAMICYRIRANSGDDFKIDCTGLGTVTATTVRISPYPYKLD